MKDTNYVVNRDDIYVGLVVKSDTFRRYFDGNINTGSYEILRSILFVLNENNYSEDLLYNSENYPVLNFTDENVCLNLDINSIVVKKVLCLAPILKYFGYKEKLNYKDVIEIKKKFLNGKFTINNCELFGYVEINSNLNKLLGNRKFYIGNFEPVFSRKYWELIDMYGERRNIFIDFFAPNIAEKNVKKLVKTR